MSEENKERWEEQAEKAAHDERQKAVAPIAILGHGAKSYPKEDVLSALRTMAKEGDAETKSKVNYILTVVPRHFDKPDSTVIAIEDPVTNEPVSYPRAKELAIHDSRCICKMVNHLTVAEKKRLVEILERD